jgi:hypothetical protein
VPRATLTALFVLGCLTTADASSDPEAQALRFFESLARADADDILRRLRPPPASPDDRARAIAVLPGTGELSADRHERAKLEKLEKILSYHGRTEAFTIKLIDVPQATVAIHHRAVLLISRPALRNISAAELQALVAHEIGHEYFWRDFEGAVARSDENGRRELELKCDGIAVLTLVALRLDPLTLTDGLRKLTKFNDLIGATANANEYPPLRQRERFIKVFRVRHGAFQPDRP